MDYIGLPGLLCPWDSQVKNIAWIVMPLLQTSSQHRDQIPISLRGRFFTTEVPPWEALVSDWVASAILLWVGIPLDESITLVFKTMNLTYQLQNRLFSAQKKRVSQDLKLKAHVYY